MTSTPVSSSSSSSSQRTLILPPPIPPLSSNLILMVGVGEREKSRWVEVEVEVCEWGQGQALSSISALEGVIIPHPGVTGANTVIWMESRRRNPEEEAVAEEERAISGRFRPGELEGFARHKSRKPPAPPLKIGTFLSALILKSKSCSVNVRSPLELQWGTSGVLLMGDVCGGGGGGGGLSPTHISAVQPCRPATERTCPVVTEHREASGPSSSTSSMAPC
ncbi:unnamed protein product [Pleuronectes platessa]|uniref:Uncharacterized protein n=1 Tax=Pleuronectes platessa TaxID=8262 RepID=A0A9N7VYA1_PLEPL|nr:unnamed protein product [Pleuronectes platessa]